MADSASRRSFREGLLCGDLEDMERATLCGTLCRSRGETTLGAHAAALPPGGRLESAESIAILSQPGTGAHVRWLLNLVD
jgi:hypothetical protein